MCPGHSEEAKYLFTDMKSESALWFQDCSPKGLAVLACLSHPPLTGQQQTPQKKSRGSGDPL